MSASSPQQLRQRKDRNHSGNNKSSSSNRTAASTTTKADTFFAAHQAQNGEDEDQEEIDLNAPRAQSMEDDEKTTATPDATPAAASPPSNMNGTHLYMSSSLKSTLSKRRDELLLQYPDLLTRDLSHDPNVPDQSESISAKCRFDLILFVILGSLVCYLLYIEYDLNIPFLVGDYFRRLLDPGQIQRTDPSLNQVPLSEDPQVVEAAMRAVKERLGGGGGGVAS